MVRFLFLAHLDELLFLEDSILTQLRLNGDSIDFYDTRFLPTLWAGQVRHRPSFLFVELAIPQPPASTASSISLLSNDKSSQLEKFFGMG